MARRERVALSAGGGGEPLKCVWPKGQSGRLVITAAVTGGRQRHRKIRHVLTFIRPFSIDALFDNKIYCHPVCDIFPTEYIYIYYCH